MTNAPALATLALRAHARIGVTRLQQIATQRSTHARFLQWITEGESAAWRTPAYYTKRALAIRRADWAWAVLEADYSGMTPPDTADPYDPDPYDTNDVPVTGSPYQAR